MSEFAVPDITTPCHGAKLLIITTYEGGYLGSDVPSEIMCAAEGCGNSWTPQGISDQWNRANTAPAPTAKD